MVCVYSLVCKFKSIRVARFNLEPMLPSIAALSESHTGNVYAGTCRIAVIFANEAPTAEWTNSPSYPCGRVRIATGANVCLLLLVVGLYGATGHGLAETLLGDKSIQRLPTNDKNFRTL